MQKILRCLTIAGLDASGGAGLIADISTFHEFGCYGQGILTTIVTMKPENWQHQVEAVSPESLDKQVATVLASEQEIAALKTGMLGTPATVELARDCIERSGTRHVVIDPVLVCKGTDEVLNPDTEIALRTRLLPLAEVITPNLFEAGRMAELKTPSCREEVEACARGIIERGARNVVIKGGRSLSDSEALDLFYDGQEMHWLSGEKIDHAATHGAGCSFAAAVTAALANGQSPLEAVKTAKAYVAAAIKHGFAYNQFVSPVFRPGYRQEQA